MPSRPAAAACWLLIAAALCSGCGQGTAQLAGTVTLGGKPIPDDAKGVIGFTPTGATPDKTVTAAIEAGAYRVSGVPTGSVTATFQIVRPKGPVKKSERTGQEYQDEEVLVPPQHLGGIAFQLEGDDLQRNFDL